MVVAGYRVTTEGECCGLTDGLLRRAELLSGLMYLTLIRGNWFSAGLPLKAVFKCYYIGLQLNVTTLVFKGGHPVSLKNTPKWATP